jgi:hypothetical protein
MAGGVAATALTDADTDEDAFAVTVTVGDGFGPLLPHADSAAATATAPARATAADLYVAAGMSGSPWGESSGTGFRARNHAATNRKSGDDLDSARPDAARGCATS